MVGGLEPGDPAIGPNVHCWRDGLRIVQAADAEIDEPRVVGFAPRQRSAAAAAEMPERLRRGTIGDGVASGHHEGVERHCEPGNHRRAMRALAHPAMAVLRLDGHGGNAVAYLAAQAAAGKIFSHNLSPPGICR